MPSVSSLDTGAVIPLAESLLLAILLAESLLAMILTCADPALKSIPLQMVVTTRKIFTVAIRILLLLGVSEISRGHCRQDELLSVEEHARSMAVLFASR
jgi:hypothetical protein